MSTEKEAVKVQRTSAGLRGALFDELDGLRDGSINATKANATAKIAGAIVDTVNMEMAAYKLLRGSSAKPLDSSSHLPSLSLVAAE